MFDIKIEPKETDKYYSLTEMLEYGIYYCQSIHLIVSNGGYFVIDNTKSYTNVYIIPKDKIQFWTYYSVKFRKFFGTIKLTQGESNAITAN